MKVTVMPSGHHFDAAQGESVLEEALRAGVALDYGCQNGGCGDCKARLLSGSVAKIGHSDVRLSDRERDDGVFLTCRNTPTSDIVIEAAEFNSAAQIPFQQQRGKLGKSEAYGEGVIGLRVRLSRSQPLHFLPGQSVDLQFDGFDKCRFAIASCPCNGSQIELHVPRRDNDPVADFLFGWPRCGTPVDVSGPFGDLDFDDEIEKPHLFIAYGTGFAPIKAVIEHVFAREHVYPMQLLWFARDRRHYQSNHCRMWDDVMDNFDFSQIVIDHADTGLPETAQISQQLADVLDANPAWRNYRVFMAAPDELNAALTETLLSRYPATELNVLAELNACI